MMGPALLSLLGDSFARKQTMRKSLRTRAALNAIVVLDSTAVQQWG